MQPSCVGSGTDRTQRRLLSGHRATTSEVSGHSDDNLGKESGREFFLTAHDVLPNYREEFSASGSAKYAFVPVLLFSNFQNTNLLVIKIINFRGD